ncbi:MAG: hypothetical protein IKJ95_07675 [Bacteroidaceae bacterium]|nr:hypothetical protein [Bacteroidaceae bacterium]
MLIVNSITRHRYTLRDFLECEYPELLEAAESGCAVLTGLQNAIVELLPLSKRLLPGDIKQLADVGAQANLMACIYHHSLFAFADKVYTILNAQCTALAEALNSNLKADEEVAANKLEKTLRSLGNIPFDKLLDNSATCLLRLEVFKDYLQERLDFIVIPIFDLTGKIHAHWSFRDITGSIAMNGLDERLLNDFINAPLPDAPTIGKVVDDETLQRIY